MDNKGTTEQNDWSTSALQAVLNRGAYYNRTSGECPYGKNGVTTPCDFTNTGLTDTAKSMIGKTKWYLGSWNTYNITTKQFYGYERGSTVSSGFPMNWVGEIGLIYMSDFGYASSESKCLTTVGLGCINWLTKSMWTIAPNTINKTAMFYLRGDGVFSNLNVYATVFAYPNVYLKSNVKITAGDGSKGNPYQLKI